MKITDLVIASLMLYTIVAAIGTLASYLLYTLFDMGSSQLSTIFFMCAMSGATCIMCMCVIILIHPIKVS